MEQVDQLLAQASLGFWLWFIPLFLLAWFFPTVLALFFNRKHSKLIAAANIPAGFSFVAWGALMLWAVGGQAGEKYLARWKKPKQR